ncbi:MAG: metallophosphoesterase family protein [Gammaproteobacteria bacterium]
MIIEIAGSLDNGRHYNADNFAPLLQETHTELTYGGSFMGRPGTRLYAGAKDIVKIRDELELEENQARRYIGQMLEQERKIAIHHPQKTWFLCRLQNGKFKVGNICPRLTPLHKLNDRRNDAGIEMLLVHIRRIYFEYLRIAAAYGLRLDEGLSNFGVDAQNKLYYLDDDVYNWDNFHSFAHLLGVLIRNNSWLDERWAEKFGCDLHNLIAEFFQDTHKSTMVANKLRDVFMPDKNRAKVLDIIIRQLQQHRAVNKKVRVVRDYIAVLADIHANLPALEAVLQFLKNENITDAIVLGDIVGYGPHPGECIDRLRDTRFTVIKGNHDHAAVTGDCQRGISSVARYCIEWSIPLLSEEQKRWLDELPMELSSSGEFSNLWIAMHGAPIDPSFFYAYVYEMTYTKNLDNLAKRRIRHCFHGHTHIQGVYARKKNGMDDFYRPEDRHLQAFKHSLICPGSVGQPRNGQTGAQFAVYSQRQDEIRFLNLPYAVEKTIHDMQKHGFPETLSERLKSGY